MINNREAFKQWTLKNFSENSGSSSSYLISLDWLSDRFFEKGKINKKTIFEIEDVDLISKLYSEVLKIQSDKNSFIFNKNAPGYGPNYYYSASIGKYKEFLIFKNKATEKLPEYKEKMFSSLSEEFRFKTYLSGTKYAHQLTSRFTASLLTKPFVILTGLSGSGKTKLAQAFVQWICASTSQYKIIPVGADWTNREPLLGYPNGLDEKLYVAPECGSLHLLMEAAKEENQSKPYFLILDEMNLSHVERYFADFLSVMESEDKIRLYSGGERKIPAAQKDEKPVDLPQEIGWPKNLFIIGTVNIDETTYMFSPKVLDRANVIEFRISQNEMASFLKEPSKPNLNQLCVEGRPEKGGLGQEMAANFLQKALDKTVYQLPEAKELTLFFAELQKVGAEFGYRTASEMLLLVRNLDLVAGEEKLSQNEKLDIAIMQKLLPKLHGSRNKLRDVLCTLAGMCLEQNQDRVKTNYLEPFYQNKIAEDSLNTDGDIRFKISFVKLCRMYKTAMENGYTSYAEA